MQAFDKFIIENHQDKEPKDTRLKAEWQNLKKTVL